MLQKFLLRSIFLLLVSGFAIGTVEAVRSHPQKAIVRFLATSTSVRNSWGTSQDVYLVEIVPHATDNPVLARLVDDNPEYHEMDLRKRFASGTGTTLGLWRDPACDIAFAKMPLRTRPGDPSAILPEQLGFTPTIWRPVQPDEMLPCYRLAR